MKRLWLGVALGGLAVWLVWFTAKPYWRQHRFTHSFPLETDLSLPVELYRAGLIGNLTTMYVTDSAAFRLYAGTYDDESEFIHVQAVGDRLTPTKMPDKSYAVAMGLGDQPVVEKRVVYSLQHVRKAQSFE